jgi:hypothetical protein
VRGRQERRNNFDGWRTLETIALVDAGAKRPNGVALARQWEIPVQEPAEFAARDVSIHPYVVGLWLSDGSRGQPRITKPFAEIFEKIESLGYDVVWCSQKTFHIGGMSRSMKDAPVFGKCSPERYIPDDYKYNSVANRMALFAGLCDGDGEVHHTGSIGYSTTSRRLAMDVIWLARSLGCKAQLQPTAKSAGYRDSDGTYIECLDCYRVTINLTFNPFTIEHRRARFKCSERRYLTRWIDSIEPIAPADGMCIEVANGDGLYLANDFIVTHNSALVSWIILWAMSTAVDTRGVVTANTETQLKTKTWVELAKWYRLFICRALFRLEATSLSSIDPEHTRTWRTDMVPWSQHNPEAFAGLHNQGRRAFMVFDEASKIADIIWETASGFLSDADTERLWFAFGNPTRSQGAFRDKFQEGSGWHTTQVDARQIGFTNKAQIASWGKAYGEDSDYFRIRVRGVFPRTGESEFISAAIVAEAQAREAGGQRFDPLVIGVDVARFGDDESVLVVRKGRDARSIPATRLRGLDTMTLASRVVELAQALRADAVFIDGGGVGGGVVDRCRQLRLNVHDVQFGARADRSDIVTEGERYANKRAELWGSLRAWLVTGAIEDDRDLAAQLVAPTYGFNARDEIQLERKQDMRARGVASPDWADGLALTFAYPVMANLDAGHDGPQKPLVEWEYDPFSSERLVA